MSTTQFDQSKLSKAEWQSTEIPATLDEMTIYNLIKQGFHDVNICHNDTMCIFDFLKTENNQQMNTYIYETFILPNLQKLHKKYNVDLPIYSKQNIKNIKKADKIRIENSQDKVNTMKESILEFVLIEFIEKMMKYKNQNKSKWLKMYYTLSILTSYEFKNINQIFLQWTLCILDKYQPENTRNLYDSFLGNIQDNIETNKALLKYKNIELYQHQKQLFSIFNQEDSYCESKLVFYTAPTGTGKTLSPIGLSEKYKIIFICAARHVGLSLAKVAVNVGKKIAFAFGCNQMEDIRLHYFAVKEYDILKNGRKKPNNMIGDNVEIMICDVASYEIAMLYMKAFHPLDKMILYWDEPTISLDYDSHPLHQIIKHNWTINIIPNIVLSSATLPKQSDIPDTIISFRCKFNNPQNYTINTCDYFKTICVLSKEGDIATPHTLFERYEDAYNSAIHLQNNNTLLRYLDLSQCASFIQFVSKQVTKQSHFLLENYFTHLKEVTIVSIKEYYLQLLKSIPSELWPLIYNHFSSIPKIQCDVNIATESAYTLTYGPTIFISNDITTLAKYYIKTSKIPDSVMKTIGENLAFNQNVINTIEKKEKDLEDGLSKDLDNEKKISNNRISPELKNIQKEISTLKKSLKSIMLNDRYIPNRASHFEHWGPDTVDFIKSNVFTCSMDEEMVEKIMLLEHVKPLWKLLLLMGIGALKLDNDSSYNEIMKTLAQNQQLYLIIASSDYIYGTNYQFCHSYIGNDLSNMSQEKLIQSLGRVGRKNIQYNYTIRFRNNTILHKLFLPDEIHPEINNMNVLFA